jgi:hypothetical protein
MAEVDNRIAVAKGRVVDYLPYQDMMTCMEWVLRGLVNADFIYKDTASPASRDESQREPSQLENEIREIVFLHDLFPRLVVAHYNCKRYAADRESVTLLQF